MNYLFDELFPNRYLLTLKENTNRHKHFAMQLQLADVQNVNIVYSKKVLLRKCFKNTASRSITETHMKIHRLGLDQGTGNLLVLEDDIEFVDRFKQRIEPVLRELHTLEWDVLYFFKPEKGSSDYSGDRGEVIERYNSGLLKITGTINTHAYAVNMASLPALVKRYNSEYIRNLHPQIRIIDKSMASLGLNFFAIDENFIYQCEKFESSTRNAKQFSGLFENLVLYFQSVGNKITNN